MIYKSGFDLNAYYMYMTFCISMQDDQSSGEVKIIGSDNLSALAGKVELSVFFQPVYLYFHIFSKAVKNILKTFFQTI